MLFAPATTNITMKKAATAFSFCVPAMALYTCALRLGRAQGVLDNRMLCAGTSQGQIHAWALDAVLTHLWCLQLQLPCSCLETRGTQLLYGGITQDERSYVFEVVDDTGNIVHTEASPLYIRHIVSTRAAVYVRSGCGDLECWRVTPPPPHRNLLFVRSVAAACTCRFHSAEAHVWRQDRHSWEEDG